MSVNKLKVMLSFMREVNDGNVPSAKDYEISSEEFWDIIELCQDEGFIKGAAFQHGGMKNEIIIGILDSVKLTFKGLEYLNEHSVAMKAYKGIKDLREWLPF